ncbi:hypothetical protein [Crateriforma spongiae]|uniref:hypothetical protein n=1 Tax=Crateriforma spongiae TaxID=2724528 RepID=UPI0039AEB2C4
MQNAWGIAIATIGLLMFLGGLTKSEFVVYRVLAARTRLVWGDNVHVFYVAAGLIVAVFGVLVTMGIIGK